MDRFTISGNGPGQREGGHMTGLEGIIAGLLFLVIFGAFVYFLSGI